MKISRLKTLVIAVSLVGLWALAAHGQQDDAADSRLKRYEQFPAQSPAPGEVVPPIELRDLKGNLVSLNELLETRPVLIETGSYTCPVFRSRHASIEKLHEEFSDKVHLVVLYGKEAHPGSQRFQDIEQPRKNDARAELAQGFARELSIGVPVLADDINNPITSAYGGLPNSGILVGQDGRVFHKLAWIHPALMREPIVALLGMGGSGGADPPRFPVGGSHPSESGKPRDALQPAPESSAQPEKKNGRASADHRPRNRRAMRVPQGVTVHRDLEYASVDGHSLRLDLYIPEGAETKPAMLMWVHGGGWRNGDKGRINPTVIRLTGEGFAAASINYRLNGLAAHPEHIHDCKAAVRWLRANAEKYGYDATRIGVGGGSAGGHLALMLGMTAGVEALEGGIGGHLDQSSRVQAVLDLFGPSDLVALSQNKAQFRTRHRKTDGQLLAASPLNYLTNDDAPVLIFQGDEDPVVPMAQSQQLHERYQAAGLDSSLYIIQGAAHGGPQFSDPARHDLAKAFFEKHLLKPVGE